MAHSKMLISAAGATLAAMLAVQPAMAQTVASNDAPPMSPLLVGDEDPQASGPTDMYGRPEEPREARANDRSSRNGPAHPRVRVSPYIEVGQVVTGELSRGGDVLTYSTVAVGVESSISTRRAQAAVDLRYERRISWDDPVLNNNVVSGMARGRYDLGMGVSMEAGGLASRASVDGRGGGANFNVGDRTNTSNIYAIYAGPTFGGRVGELEVGGGYRFGYSRSDIESAPVLAAGATTVGSFDESTNHAVFTSVGMSPGRLPFGWRVSGAAERENAGQLDQLYTSYMGRLDVTYPITPTVALLGGVGYEHIQLSQAQALLTTGGVPVVDGNGRLVSDGTRPRQIAFETDGLIYDAGVMWRPNRRMMVEARVGRRYGDTSYTGSATWQASQTTGYQLGIYDSLSTVGRQLTAGLAALPTDFNSYRNPVDGSIGGCGFGSSGGQCFNSTLSNASGFAYRNRGAVLSMSSTMRPWNIGVALGYDRRTYVANGIVGIAGLDGAVDQTFFSTITASRQLSERTTLGTSIYGTWFESGLPGGVDSFTTGGSAALSHTFLPRLTGNAAVSVNMIDQEGFNNRVYGSALLGMRYSF